MPAARPTSSSSRPRSPAIDGMHDGDGLLIANFRADRVREIAAALLDPDFSGFARAKRIAFAAALGLVEYSTELNRFLATLFPPDDLDDTFGEVVSRAGLTQLRIAETEKYAHVTFFFNGGRETVFPGEERILVPSPKVGDLRPATRDVGARGHRQGGRGDSVRPVRRHRAELRQHRHGRAYRPYRRGDQGGRDRRHVPRPAVRGGRARPAARSSSPPITAMPR